MISGLISGVDSFGFFSSSAGVSFFGSGDDFDCSGASFLISGSSSSSDVESSVKASLMAEKSSASGFYKKKS